jgi:hypothetical protein
MMSRILTPKMVKKLVPDVSLTWVHENWELLGGVKIAGKKLLLEDVLYANLQKQRTLLHQGDEEWEEMVSNRCRDERKKLEYQKGGQAGGSRVAKASPDDVGDLNRFGLADCL